MTNQPSCTSIDCVALAMINPSISIDRTPYRNGVLKIQTNLSVTLARQKVSLQKVLGLVPGSMLIFDKHYAEPLMLEANGLPIATGETVKVGDKFGFRILQMAEPVVD